MKTVATENPKVHVQPGELPPAWDRRVLFFSNIHSIFYGNAGATRQLLDEISGADSYGGRVMPILDLLFRRRPNLMLLEVAPRSSLLQYFRRDLALSLPDYEILNLTDYDKAAASLARDDRRIAQLREHPADWVDGFVTDAKLVKIAELLGKQTLSTLEGSKNGNNKYLLYRHQVEEKLPVFDTLIASNQDELRRALGEVRALGYRKAVVKSQIGASGYGMLIVDVDGSALPEAPDFLFFEGPCMVQGWIEDGVRSMRKLASPSVQMFINDEAVYLYDRTEQILSEQSVHQGNMSPPPVVQEHPDVGRELWRQAGSAGAWLHRQGYRGTGSVDFLIVERNGRLETIICEINARVTGATYPAFLARYFRPMADWLMRNIGFRRPLAGTELIALMDRAGVLYRRGADRGIIPINFNTDAEGKVIKGQFVCLGSDIEDCTALLNRAWAKLPVEWGYDRD